MINSAYTFDLPLPGTLSKNDESLLVNATWCRYDYMRDSGHDKFILTAEKCQNFWWGDQWKEDDITRLRAQRRPALTINLVLQTMDVMVGEQIGGRNEIRFSPRYGNVDDRTATALNKTFKHISQGNHLTWKRTDVFEDGNITGRGFYDVRLDFTENLYGEVAVTTLNPKEVLIDPDATDYDPATWEDVIVSRWMSPNSLEALYGKKKTQELRALANQYRSAQTNDIPDQYRDRIALPEYINKTEEGTQRQDAYIRVVDRQYRVLTRRELFVDTRTGELRPVPDSWDELKTAEYLMRNPSIVQISQIAKRIRWTVVAGSTLLHDGWSPYEYLTVVPYFPHFRFGHTTGIVEQLFGVQELLNKTASQELHILNTTANSGWKVKHGSLKNMTVDDLQARGAETGLVVEVEDVGDIDKIQPNQLPAGLEGMNQKAQAWIKAISGVTDYMRGEAREDVSARALETNRMAGRAGMARILDNLDRSDVFLARAILSIVQTYYYEERLLYINGGGVNKDESFTINEVTPEGEIANDLTLGEYLVTVQSVPARETLEDSQFDQALAMRKEGINIPDTVLIQNSRLLDKADIIEQMQSEANSPEAQQLRQLQLATAQANLAKVTAEAQRAQSDAANKSAQANVKNVQAETDALKAGTDTEQQRANIEQQRVDIEAARLALEQTKVDNDLKIKTAELALDREKLRLDAVTERLKMRFEAEKAAQEPKPTPAKNGESTDA